MYAYNDVYFFWFIIDFDLTTTKYGNKSTDLRVFPIINTSWKFMCFAYEKNLVALKPLLACVNSDKTIISTYVNYSWKYGLLYLILA